MKRDSLKLREIAQLGAVLLCAVLLLYGAEKFNKKDKQVAPLQEVSSLAQSTPRDTETLPEVHGPSQFKVQRHKKDKVQPGYVLVPVSGSEEIVLMNTMGEVVHRWSGIDAARARLYPDCRLLVIHGSKWGLQFEKWRERKKSLTLYDWNGDILREYRGSDVIHHDAHLLENDHIFFLESELIPYPASYPGRPNDARARIKSDRVFEINRTSKKVYRWNAEDHLDLVGCGWNGCEKRRKTKDERAHIWDWSHINTASLLPENKHFDGGDTRFRPGNFFVVPRNFWHAYLIDRESGKIVWDYFGQGTEQDYEQRLIRGHEAHMIPKGYPGAGNILIFDNGYDAVRPYSRILEVDPITKEIVWSYADKERFYSRGAGSVQRLKNGNTLISEDKRGRVFEVSPEGDIVWGMKASYRVSRAHKYDGNICSQLIDSAV